MSTKRSTTQATGKDVTDVEAFELAVAGEEGWIMSVTDVSHDSREYVQFKAGVAHARKRYPVSEILVRDHPDVFIGVDGVPGLVQVYTAAGGPASSDEGVSRLLLALLADLYRQGVPWPTK